MVKVIIDYITKYDGKGAKKAETAAGKVSKAWGAVGISAAAGFALAGAAAVKFGADSIAKAKEQMRVEAQLEAVIKSTGRAAGLSADEIKGMASELQNLTNFGDEAIIGAQNVLLTFTKIGSEVFPQATNAVLDMATALDMDLKSASIQVGKALNDPIKGVGALSRAGVQFSVDQKAMIESLVTTGDIAGAQAIILSELETQFKGSAAAAREADGGFIALKNTFGDIQETLAMPFLEGFGDGFESLNKIAQAVAPDLAEAAEYIAEGFGKIVDLGDGMSVILEFAKWAAHHTKQAAKGFLLLAKTIKAVDNVLTALINKIPGLREVLAIINPIGSWAQGAREGGSATGEEGSNGTEGGGARRRNPIIESLINLVKEDKAKNAGFAYGGDPPVGVSSWVGENGPEMIRPTTNYNISPNVSVSGGVSRSEVNGIVNNAMQNLVNDLDMAMST